MAREAGHTGVMSEHHLGPLERASPRPPCQVFVRVVSKSRDLSASASQAGKRSDCSISPVFAHLLLSSSPCVVPELRSLSPPKSFYSLIPVTIMLHCKGTLR